MNFLVDVEGIVELKRQGWTDYVPVTFGTCLQWGDLVRVGSTAPAVIVCADLSVQPLTSGYFGGLPCPHTTPVLVREEVPILSPRSSALPLYPLILSPRATALLDPHPLFRWSPVTDVVTYTVTVRGRGLSWQIQTQQTEIQYPTSAPSLQADSDGYVLVVEANDHSSEDEGGAFRGFTLLNDAAVQQVRNYERQIANLGASDAAHRYLTAQMYASYGLRADAIVELEKLVPEIGTPAVWNELAEQYLTVGLYDQAADSYAAALSLAESAGDLLSQAQAELGFARAYRGLNDVARALPHTKRSLELFQSLGDEVGLTCSSELLKELGTP